MAHTKEHFSGSNDFFNIEGEGDRQFQSNIQLFGNQAVNVLEDFQKRFPDSPQFLAANQNLLGLPDEIRRRGADLRTQLIRAGGAGASGAIIAAAQAARRARGGNRGNTAALAARAAAGASGARTAAIANARGQSLNAEIQALIPASAHAADAAGVLNRRNDATFDLLRQIIASTAGSAGPIGTTQQRPRNADRFIQFAGDVGSQIGKKVIG